MIAETIDTTTVQTLQQTIDRLRSDLENVQRELDQALGVWRSIAATERKDFEALLAAKQAVWEQQDAQWEKQRSVYETKIQELEGSFQSQLKATEEQALKALQQLDETWRQRVASIEEKTSETLQDLRTAWERERDRLKRQTVETQVHALESGVQALEDFVTLWSAPRG